MSRYEEDYKSDKAKVQGNLNNLQNKGSQAANSVASTVQAKAKEMANDVRAAAGSEIEDIKEDIDSLKTNVIGLAKNLKEVGTDKARAASVYVQDRVEDLKATGTDTVRKVEARIKSKPSQSVAIAFCAGIVASYLLGRKKA